MEVKRDPMANMIQSTLLNCSKAVGFTVGKTCSKGKRTNEYQQSVDHQQINKLSMNQYCYKSTKLQHKMLTDFFYALLLHSMLDKIVITIILEKIISLYSSFDLFKCYKIFPCMVILGMSVSLLSKFPSFYFNFSIYNYF